jgi:hypothetical protein
VQGSWVGAVTGPRLDGPLFDCRHCKTFVFSKTSTPPLGLTPMETAGCCSEVQQPEREADCSVPSNAEVKNAWSHTCIPHNTLWHA